ncbi:MauE/DoxX family redox-associated membrane protein [Streptosporangium sp. NPDC049248]|uniref:MauE/DoxX family redox-associated membrane protein n=1 Tax=Streptosporangium sp. NPDC049248 TaxID=3155651 RepID=UPI00342A2783
MGYVSVGAMTLLSTIFAVSCVGKARNLKEFAGALRSFASERTSMLLAAMVTALEGLTLLAFAISLAGVRWAAVLGFLLAGSLLLAFTLVMRRIQGAHCHCFGKHGTRYSARHVVRNVLLTSAAMAGLVEHHGAAGPEPDGIIVAMAFGLLIGLFVVMMDDLVEVLRPAGSR